MNWLLWMLEGPPEVLQYCARQVWFYTGNIEPKPFGHFFSCKEKVMLLTQCTWDLRTYSIYLGILAVQLILRSEQQRSIWHFTTQIKHKTVTRVMFCLKETSLPSGCDLLPAQIQGWVLWNTQLQFGSPRKKSLYHYASACFQDVIGVWQTVFHQWLWRAS